MKQVTFENVLVTPTMAKKWLEDGNNGNRKLRQDYAKNLALQMIENTWREGTGVPIIFDEYGGVIDGQHRLNAIVIANKPIKFTIARNVNREVQDVIDTGLNRQASDVLSFSGVKNSGAVASIVKYYLLNGNGNSSKTQQRVINATNRLVRDEYLKEPDFWQNIFLSSQARYKQFRALTTTQFGGCNALALRQSKFTQKVNVFFDQLASGATSSPAILELRKKIINNQLSDKKYSSVVKRELIKTYFNGYIKDQKTPYSHPDGIWL